MNPPRLVLVLGGASSGKSEFAESLVLKTARSPVYLATTVAQDDETRERITQHRKRRSADWRTIEEPIDVSGAISGCCGHEIVLFECATLWLLNLLTAGHDAESGFIDLLEAFKTAPCPVIAVTNEIGMGVVPRETFTRTFLSLHGRLNQELSENADAVILVAAGLPLALKGSIPA